jgi:lysyl-tRNA synthetase class 1
MKQEENSEELFWADKLAKQIINRDKFHYIDKKIKKFDIYTVKTSASLSGVLHIGRLSDTIRSESVYKALKDANANARLIWVAEDMDPLRKVPKNVPKDYEKYLGMPVTDVPDADGCHSSYAEHFKDEYFKVIDSFVSSKMEKFSMREEYKKGHFKKYIKMILEKAEEVREIQNKYRTIKLEKGYSPWKPICDNCGKIVTTHVTGFSEGIVKYRCKDYDFEATTAKGCGHRGTNNPLEGNGKLLWKSEWAAEWARWGVVSEGAGKEYQVPNSAWWVNGEIAEKVFNFPMPVPIFYEHIMIDNQKMSASLGNVIYPKDWLEVAPPELLRLFYNKRLMTTRSFSWQDLPKLYDEYEKYQKIYLGEIKLENKKEEQHKKRLFGISMLDKAEKPLGISFGHAAMIAQISPTEEDIVKNLKKTGHYKKTEHKRIMDIMHKAKIWLEKYAPEEMKFEVQQELPKNLNLTKQQKEALKLVAASLRKRDFDEKALFEEFYNICKKTGVKNTDFFKAAYNVLLNKDKGPRLAPFILALGKEKVVSLFERL